MPFFWRVLVSELYGVLINKLISVEITTQLLETKDYGVLTNWLVLS
jgi:hypothetical protein